MTLGSLLRTYRKQKKLTLKSVAERAGVSEGFMSQVENSVKSPSVDTLMHICDALEVNVGDLLNQLKSKERLFTLSKAEWDDVEVPHTGFVTRRFCSPEDRSVIDTAVLFLEKSASIPVRKNIRNGQELLCVLSGDLELVHGDRAVRISEGDTVHFWSDPAKQRITNIGDRRAVVLWVGTL